MIIIPIIDTNFSSFVSKAKATLRFEMILRAKHTRYSFRSGGIFYFVGPETSIDELNVISNV